jgi:hypothetical protein
MVSLSSTDNRLSAFSLGGTGPSLILRVEQLRTSVPHHNISFSESRALAQPPPPDTMNEARFSTQFNTTNSQRKDAEHADARLVPRPTGGLP